MSGEELFFNIRAQVSGEAGVRRLGDDLEKLGKDAEGVSVHSQAAARDTTLLGQKIEQARKKMEKASDAYEEFGGADRLKKLEKVTAAHAKLNSLQGRSLAGINDLTQAEKRLERQRISGEREVAKAERSRQADLRQAERIEKAHLAYLRKGREEYARDQHADGVSALKLMADTERRMKSIESLQTRNPFRTFRPDKGGPGGPGGGRRGGASGGGKGGESSGMFLLNHPLAAGLTLGAPLLPALGPVAASSMAGLASAGAALGTLLLSVKGVSAAMQAAESGDLKKYSESMQDLAPAARGFVHELVGVSPALHDFRMKLQDGFFRPLTGDLTNLTKVYLPALSQDMPRLAATIGGVGHNLVAWATGEDTVKRVQQVVKNAATDTAILGATTKNVLDNFLNLGVDTHPIFQTLLVDLQQGSREFGKWEKGLDWKALLHGSDAALGALGKTASIVGKTLSDFLLNPNTVNGAANLIGSVNGILGGVSSVVKVVGKADPVLISLGTQLFATGFLASKSAGMLTKFADKLNIVGKDGEITGTKMGKFGKTLQGALGGAAIIGTVAAVGYEIGRAFWDKITTPDAGAIRNMDNSLAMIGRGGAARKAGFGGVGRELAVGHGALSDAEAAQKKAGNWGWNTDIIGKLQANADHDAAQKTLAQQYGSINRNITGQIGNGGIAQAESDYIGIGKAALKAGVSLADFKKNTQASRDALEAAAASANGSALAFNNTDLKAQLLAGGMAGLMNSAFKVTDAYNVLNGAMINQDSSMLGQAQALDKIHQSFASGNKSMSEYVGHSHELNTAGLSNRVMIEQYGASLANTMQTMRENHATEAQLVQVWNDGKNSLLAAARAAGIHGDALKTIESVLGKMPDKTVSNLVFPQLEHTNSVLDDIDRKLTSGLPDRTVNVTTVYRRIGTPDSIDRLPAGGAPATGGKKSGIDLGTILNPPIFSKPKGKGSASGGWVTGGGTETSDSNVYHLSRNEFVVRASVAKKNRHALETLNATGTISAGTGRSNWLARNGGGIDSSLADLTSTGSGALAGKLFGQLANAWVGAGGSLKALTGALHQYKAAQVAANAAAADSAAKVKLMQVGMGSLVAGGQKLSDIFDRLNGGIIGFDHAQLSAHESTLGLGAKIKENGRNLDAETIAGQRNRVAIEDVITATRDAAQAKLEQTHSAQAAMTVWINGINSLRNAASAAGLSSFGVDAIIAQAGILPGMSGTNRSAGSDLSTIGAAIGGIHRLPRPAPKHGHGGTKHKGGHTTHSGHGGHGHAPHAPKVHPTHHVPTGDGFAYHITVNAGISNPAETGRAVVEAIKAHEKRNGAGWRS